MAAKKKAAGAAGKGAVKKAAKKKTGTKKATAKKTTAKKTTKAPAKKKSTAKKATPKRGVAAKQTAKKALKTAASNVRKAMVFTRAAVKEATKTRSATESSAVKKAAPKKPAPTKAAPKKAAPTKAAPKKTAPKEAPMIDVGMPAPAFSLLDDSGERVNLADYRGKHVVLYFYPKDDTPGCTIEACSFRDRHGEIRALGAIVFGVSPDDRDSHVKFVNKFNLNFPLLVDEGAELAKKLGVWKEKNMYGKKSMGIERSTFLIDRDGVIRRAWRRVKVEGHDDEVIAALREM